MSAKGGGAKPLSTVRKCEFFGKGEFFLDIYDIKIIFVFMKKRKFCWTALFNKNVN